MIFIWWFIGCVIVFVILILFYITDNILLSKKSKKDEEILNKPLDFIANGKRYKVLRNPTNLNLIVYCDDKNIHERYDLFVYYGTEKEKILNTTRFGAYCKECELKAVENLKKILEKEELL